MIATSKQKHAITGRGNATVQLKELLVINVINAIGQTNIMEIQSKTRVFVSTKLVGLISKHNIGLFSNFF